MPMKSRMKPALSMMTSAPSKDEPARKADLYVPLGNTSDHSRPHARMTSFASNAKRSMRISPGNGSAA